MKTNKDRVEQGLERLGEKRCDSSDFVSAEEFRRCFFERARKEETRRKPLRVFSFLFRMGAAAAVVVLGVWWLAQFGFDTRGQDAAGRDSTSCAVEQLRPEVERETGTFRQLLHEVALLFGGRAGAGFFGDEIFTYERQSEAVPDRLLRLSVFDRNLRPEGEVVLALNGEDAAIIRSRNITGEVVVVSADNGAEVVDANLRIRLASGRELSLSEQLVGPETVSYRSGDNMVVRREIVRM